MAFKKDFVWGCATAAYQIEGAVNEGGKGPSVWDVYCKQAGNVVDGKTGDVACDHYHRYKEDVRLMKELGMKAYRFSISWSRIMPEGTGKVNQEGIDFYNNLIDELIANDITPYITLFHWDLPYALHQRGGWMNREISDWFAEYARVVAENFSDRVKHYFTFNEPQCFIGFGYITAENAPGLKMTLEDTTVMSHNVLMSHGKAVLALRKYGKGKLTIGYAPTFGFVYPQTENERDIEAARRYNYSMHFDQHNWAWNLVWWSDPVYLGSYPADGLEVLGKYLPDTWEEDLKIINQPLDFVGQNFYNGLEVKADENGNAEFIERYEGHPRTAIGWPITPRAIKWLAKFLYERYKLPVLITENGISCTDVISLDGKVHDPNRIDYVTRYLRALNEAVEEGVELDGYFYWSIMDNFEWAKGFSERFGLIYIDYPTQQRIIKDSGYWFKSVIESNGENIL